MTLPLYFSWAFFSVAFNIVSLFCIFIVLIIIYHMKLFLCSYIFSVLYISCILIDTSLFNLEKKFLI